jgi:hypothetical protein
MRRQDLMAILGTFFVGVLVGGYLYLYGFSTQFAPLGQLTEVETFTVLAESYGGCNWGGFCATFQLNTDGTFRAFPAAFEREERVRREGEVASGVMRELRDVFTAEYLFSLAEPIESVDCASFVEGIDYRYRIIRGDEQYTLDTCDTALAYDASARDQLRNLFSDVGL